LDGGGGGAPGGGSALVVSIRFLRNPISGWPVAYLCVAPVLSEELSHYRCHIEEELTVFPPWPPVVGLARNAGRTNSVLGVNSSATAEDCSSRTTATLDLAI
jgi:hypothetical protein